MTTAPQYYATLNVGDTAVVAFTITDNDPASNTYQQKIDPNTVGVNWSRVAGNTISRWVYGTDPQVVKVSKGVYEAYIPCTNAGDIEFRPYSDAPGAGHPGTAVGRIRVQGSRLA